MKRSIHQINIQCQVRCIIDFFTTNAAPHNSVTPTRSKEARVTSRTHSARVGSRSRWSSRIMLLYVNTPAPPASGQLPDVYIHIIQTYLQASIANIILNVVYSIS